MPWIFNPSRDVQTVKMLDGVVSGFPPRQKVYIAPEKMSAEAWRLIQAGQLVNKGGDPIVQKSAHVTPDSDRSIPPESINTPDQVTSSSHHHMDDRVSVNSSNALGEKEVKAEKKQTDQSEKATSETSEVGTQSNDKQKIDKRNRRRRR